eukprot:15981725-Heterocapsa_arctica.AAC.1
MTGGRAETAKPKGLYSTSSTAHISMIRSDEDPDDSEHKHNKRKTDNEEHNADKKTEEDDEEPYDGIYINKQARQIT